MGRAGLAGGLDGPEGEQGENEECDRSVGVATGDEFFAEAKQYNHEVSKPDNAGHTEFEEGDAVGVLEPEERAEYEGGGEADCSGNEEPPGDRVELLNGGKEGIDPAVVLVFQAMLLEEKHGRNKRENREDPITENCEGGMEFNPWLAPEASGGIGLIPGGEEGSGQPEESGECRGEKPEETELANGTNDEVEEDCRP